MAAATAAADAAEEERRVRQRLQADIHTPALVLYQHALEATFAFASLPELHSLQLVCRAWMAAVRRMRPTAGVLRSVRGAAAMHQLCSSSLARHLVELRADRSKDSNAEGRWIRVSAASLDALSRQAPQLHTLQCDVDFRGATAGSVRLPPSLTVLHIHSDLRALLEDPSANAPSPRYTSLLPSLAPLPRLRSLLLHLTSFVDVDFTPLLSVASLRELELRSGTLWTVPLTPAHIGVLRRMTQLQRFTASLTAQLLGQLLAQPHQLQWTELGGLSYLSEPAAALLPLLPSLTRLDASRSQLPRLTSLPLLQPALTDLTLGLSSMFLPADHDWAGFWRNLSRCTSLTRLHLLGSAHLNFDAHQLAETLAGLPNVSCLTIDHPPHGALSLDYLLSVGTSCPLTSLTIRCADVAQMALTQRHCFATLTKLTSLRLVENSGHGGAAEALLAEPQRTFHPPCAQMPALRDFAYLVQPLAPRAGRWK
jgi:hypothetical protein